MQLSDIRDAAQALGYGSDTAAQQTIFINDCYREITSKLRWPFLEKQDSTLVTVAGTGIYSLPMSDWRNLDAVRLQQTTSQIYVNTQYMQPQDFRDLEHTDRFTGTSYRWTQLDQKLHLFPIPDDVYTIVIDYIFEPPDLVNDGDVPVLPTPYHDILVWGCVESAAYRSRDWIGRQFAQSKKEQKIQRMEEEYLIRQRQTSSHVKKTGQWRRSQPPVSFLLGE